MQTTADLYVRYGIRPRLDAGYKYTFGSHVFDAQYQLLGPTGSVEKPGAGAAPGTLYASIGLQFASQRAKLPSIPFLSDINSVLNLSATPPRHPHSAHLQQLVRHRGVHRGHQLRRGLRAQLGELRLRPHQNLQWLGARGGAAQQSRDFSSFGGFVNLKIGYRYVYFVPAVSVFYQNYGNFALLNNQNVSIKGLTVIPSIGFQLRIPNFTN